MRNGKKVSSYCLRKSGSCHRFRTDCILGELGLARPLDSGKLGGEGSEGTTMAHAPLYRSRAEAGGKVAGSLRGVEAGILRVNVIEGPFLGLPAPPRPRPSFCSAQV